MTLLTGRDLLKRLRSGKRLLADGGMGSELVRRGVCSDDVLGANSRVPDVVRSIHSAYLEAGAQIITTNTFGIPRNIEWADALRAGVRLANEACIASRHEASVWMSLVPRIAVNEIGVIRQVVRDLSPRPDVFLIETCTSLLEALAAIDALAGLEPAMLCVTCHFTRDAFMLDGTPLLDAIRAVEAAGATVVGANCGDEPDTFGAFATAIRPTVKAMTLFQPNAGIPTCDEETSGLTYPLSPAEFSTLGMTLFRAGAAIVGGCCGTTPEHIAALSGALRADETIRVLRDVVCG